MRALIAAPLALGIALTSLAAFAANDASGQQLHSYRAIHHRTAVARAEAPTPATLFPARGPWPYPLSTHETDGLSRNPNDCVKYGCIDNGGG
jgi:hypothetical protein